MRAKLNELANVLAGRGDYSDLTLKQRIDLVSVMITVAIAGVVGYVSINIMSSTEESTNLASGDPFYESQTNLTDGLQSFYGQLGTIFTVIALVVIIAYLMLLRRGR